MKHMKRYIEEIDTDKSDFIFHKYAGKENIHEDGLGDKIVVLYEFLDFFKCTYKNPIIPGMFSIVQFQKDSFFISLYSFCSRRFVVRA